jgi:hypothetical protein
MFNIATAEAPKHSAPKLTSSAVGVMASKPIKLKAPKVVSERVTLHDGSTVPKKDYDFLLQHLLSRMHLLIKGRKYIFVDMCLPTFLEGFPLDNTVAGKCLSHMVGLNLLPLIDIGRNAQNARVYMRK